MKKNVFTKSIQILIVLLIILTVILPKEHSQTGIAVCFIIWLTATLGVKLWRNRKSIKAFLSNQKKKSQNSKTTSDVKPYNPEVPTPQPVPEANGIMLSDAQVKTMLCHLSIRISDKIKSAYPNAVWHWNVKPSLLDLINGKTVRISVENMDKYTHADITFDRFNRIHVEPMCIGIFVPNDDTKTDDDEQPKNEPPVVDVKAWYELIGQRVLDAQITELNANGHNRLTIKENGDIVINRQKKEVYLTSLETFPGKNYWQELVTVLEENDLTAKIAGNSLQVSWI